MGIEDRNFFIVCQSERIAFCSNFHLFGQFHCDWWNCFWMIYSDYYLWYCQSYIHVSVFQITMLLWPNLKSNVNKLYNNIQATISAFWLAENTSGYLKCRKVKLPLQILKLKVLIVKLAVQSSGIENDWQFRHLQAKFISDKQNGGQKRDDIWTN